MKYRQTVSRQRLKREGGNNLLEFGLFTLFLIPAFMGTVTSGMGLGKAIQTAQITRDAGHMFVRQVDFSQPANKNLIVRLTEGMNMTLTGGNGNVILSQVLMIGDSECTAAGLTGSACSNRYYPVITQRILVGNAGLQESLLGTPNSNLITADGTITPNNYLTNLSCRATTITNGGPNPQTGLLSLDASERTYVAESFFQIPELSFLNNGRSVRMYARNYF